MKSKRVWSAIVIVLVLMSALAPPSGATPDPEGPGEADARRQQRADGRQRARAQRLVTAGAGEAAGTSGPLQAAAAGDILTIPDGSGDAPAGPRGDVQSLTVGDAGGGGLRFTMQVAEFAHPLTDPNWVLGFTGAFWALDTSGDDEPEIAVDLYNDTTALVAEVYDWESGAWVCDAIPSFNATDRSYTATVHLAGCLGEVRRPAVAGQFDYNPPGGMGAYDIVPNDGHLVRFNRPPPGRPAGGYAIVTRGGGFQRAGALPPGATPSGTIEHYTPPSPLVGAATARSFDPALWAVSAAGDVYTQDGAPWYEDILGQPLFRPIVGMAVLPDSSGYWLVASDGGVFAFGDAGFYGSTGGIVLDKPVVGMAATPSGLGYWLVASDGGIFSFGDAPFYGSTGGIPLHAPVVGMAAGYQGQGYWLVASDGGIFSFGLPFYGSTGGIALHQPIVGMAPTRSGGGYRFVARDGGVFCFGDAEFHGSIAMPGRSDVIGMATA